MLAARRISKEVEDLRTRTETIKVIASSESTVDLNFLGPPDTKFHEWFEIKVEFGVDYPFRPCSITFVGNRPKHWFYWKSDNLSKDQDFGLFYGIWSPQITVAKAIELINHSLVHPEEYENNMSGQFDSKYRKEVDDLFQ